MRKHFPQWVQLHNYPYTNSSSSKYVNWKTLNCNFPTYDRKGLQKIKLHHIKIWHQKYHRYWIWSNIKSPLLDILQSDNLWKVKTTEKYIPLIDRWRIVRKVSESCHPICQITFYSVSTKGLNYHGLKRHCSHVGTETQKNGRIKQTQRHQNINSDEKDRIVILKLLIFFLLFKTYWYFIFFFMTFLWLFYDFFHFLDIF